MFSTNKLEFLPNDCMLSIKVVDLTLYQKQKVYLTIYFTFRYRKVHFLMSNLDDKSVFFCPDSKSDVRLFFLSSMKKVFFIFDEESRQNPVVTLKL